MENEAFIDTYMCIANQNPGPTFQTAFMQKEWVK